MDKELREKITKLFHNLRTAGVKDAEFTKYVSTLIEEAGYVQLADDQFILTGLHYLKEMVEANQEIWQSGGK